MNCFEKCTYFFANITVRMIREMHQSDWEKLFRFETMDPERREGRGQGHHRRRGEGGGSRERNEGRGGEGGEGRQHGRERGMARARRHAVSDISVDAWQGWIRHARGFHPRCLSRANIAVMMKRFFGLSQTNDGMLGQNYYFCCCLCIVLYSTVH